MNHVDKYLAYKCDQGRRRSDCINAQSHQSYPGPDEAFMVYYSFNQTNSAYAKVNPE